MTKLNSLIRRGAVEGRLTKVDRKNSTITIGGFLDLPLSELAEFAVIAPPPLGTLFASSDDVEMVVTEAESELLLQAGARLPCGTQIQ